MPLYKQVPKNMPEYNKIMCSGIFCVGTPVLISKIRFMKEEKDERSIVKQATNNGVSFEKAAIISRSIKHEGVKGYAFLQMLEARLNDEQKKK